jgi:hypothetical protein
MSHVVMTVDTLTRKRSREIWGGGAPKDHRIYFAPVSQSEFLAYGVHEPNGKLSFVVTGDVERELEALYLLLLREGASITPSYGPRVATDDQGHDLPGSLALERFFAHPPIGENLDNPPPPPHP